MPPDPQVGYREAKRLRQQRLQQRRRQIQDRMRASIGQNNPTAEVLAQFEVDNRPEYLQPSLQASPEQEAPWVNPLYQGATNLGEQLRKEWSGASDRAAWLGNLYATEGPQKFLSGIKQMWGAPTSDERFEGATDAIVGGGITALPAVAPALASMSPALLAVGVGTGLVGEEVAGRAAEYVGATPAQVEAARAAGGFLDPTHVGAGSLAASTLIGATRTATRRTGAELVSRLRPTLSAPELRRLENGLAGNPRVEEALSFLKPEEVPTLLRSNGGIEAFVQSLDAVTPVNVVRAAAAAGEVKLGWFEHSRQAIEMVFGDDADLFAGVLAATSPQTSVESNLINSLNFFVNWKAAGRPRDRAQVRSLLSQSVQGGSEKSALDAWVGNVESLIADNAQTISGPKVDSFWTNLRSRWKETPHGNIDPQDAVVLDAWMGQLLGVPQTWFSGSSVPGGISRGDPGLQARYLAGTARMRQVADVLGISPSEAQETTWSTVYALYNKSKALGVTPQEVLSQGLLTPDDIGGTPDFAALLQDERYASILSRDTELASRLPGLENIPARGGRSLSRAPEHDADMQQVAGIVNMTQRARGAETILATGTGGPDAPLMAVVPEEIVGDVGGTSVLPNTVESPRRTSGSRRVFDAATNPFGQNELMARGVGTAGDVTRAQSATGHWRGPDGVQQNPMQVTGVTVPRGAQARRGVERVIRAVRDVQGGLTGQASVAHVILDPQAAPGRWNAVTVGGSSNSKPIKAEQFAALSESMSDDWVAVHKKRGLEFLHINPDTGDPLPVTDADVQQIGQWMLQHVRQVDAKGKPFDWDVRGAENVAQGGYKPMAEGAAPGSGQRTQRMVGPGSDWSRLPAAQRRQMDASIQRRAAGILDMVQSQKRVLRPDELEMLTIAARRGGSGLARALKDPAKVLPALAALGIGLDSE